MEFNLEIELGIAELAAGIGEFKDAPGLSKSERTMLAQRDAIAHYTIGTTRIAQYLSLDPPDVDSARAVIAKMGVAVADVFQQAKNDLELMDLEL